MNDNKRIAPRVGSPLRSGIVTSPDVIRKASGIILYGKRIKSIIYTMDVSLIANCDADAILCVYPWTPNTKILEAVAKVANAPVLAGIGGGLTTGKRSARIGMLAEENSASAVVLNGPTTTETIDYVSGYVDIPIIYTVITKNVYLQDYIDAGVKIFNVAGGVKTPELVRWVREQFPDFPIIASGGKTDAQILETIEAGANAITYTSYGTTEHIFQAKMEQYRKDSEEQE